MKKMYLKTFGCQMNVYDSARIKETLAVLGFTETEDLTEADIVVLNTCHIREKAAEKLYSEIGRIAMIKKERALKGKETVLVVVGCVVQAEKEELLERAKAVDIALGPSNYHQLPILIEQLKRQKKAILKTNFANDKFDSLPPVSSSKASAYLAIQEGCDNFCSYCVVPYTRGCEYSRSLAEILEEANNLVSVGAKEIMLLGQNVNCWHGKDKSGNELNMGDLLYAIADVKGLKRIRYMTSYPSKMPQKVIDAHREIPTLMPYIHLPMQAGSDKVLKAMNRQYTADEYLDIVRAFRLARPDIAISSDFIVGFPGETKEDFEETMKMVGQVEYASSFSFKYSPRPGTPASLMKNQVTDSEKSQRLLRLQELLLQQQKQFNLNTVGKVTDVLFTEKAPKKGQVIGWTPWMQNVHLAGDESLIGKIISVKIIAATTISLTGEIV